MRQLYEYGTRGAFVENDDFAEEYAYFIEKYKSYYGTLNESQVLLMQNVIRDLENYIACGLNIEYFERMYSTSKEKYAQKKAEQYRKEHGNKDVSSKRNAWKKEWEKQAQRCEYRAMYGIVEFIRKIEDILDDAERMGEHDFVVSNAIKKLASKKSKISRIDHDNKALHDLYEKMLKKDLEEFKKNQGERVEHSIDSLRKTTLYIHKNNDGLRTGDRRFIGNSSSSLTFEQVFDRLRNLAKKTTFSVKNESSSNDLNQGYSYNERIAELGNLIKTLKSNQEKSINEQGNYSLTDIELEKFKRLNSDIYGKISNIERVYEKLKSNEKKYQKVLVYIDAMNERIRAIDESINALENNDTRIFKNTLKLLHEERSKCLEELNKYQEIIRLIDKLFDEISVIRKEIDVLIVPCNEIMKGVRERQGKENEERRKKEIELQERLKANEEFKNQDRQEKIDRIKEDVLRRMRFQGYNPRDFNHKDETYEEDLEEFNRIFRQMLIMELNANGIIYDEADLSNPLDTNYHLESKENIDDIDKDKSGHSR